ncbi:acetolactate synthase small subunit [Elongatibacter sediminis]|uniref:Acetolactate synthase small subunit n=1 Tax=Elongatibacter sediminis TaxID=3119006 RepID=A0AAW9RJZ9_9GAMM
MRHIISILLQNEAGALARVAALFSSRGYNIESLSVAPTEHNELSRLTLVTTGSEEVIEQIVTQLEKLVDVVSIADMTQDAHIERELLLLKLRLNPGGEAAMAPLVDAFEARVMDDAAANYTVELTSANDRIDEFIGKAVKCGEIVSVVRSGAMAVARGQQVLRTR